MMKMKTSGNSVSKTNGLDIRSRHIWNGRRNKKPYKMKQMKVV